MDATRRLRPQRPLSVRQWAQVQEVLPRCSRRRDLRAALVDAAIESDDWEAIHDLVEHAMEAFEIGGPLEHVRFRDDLIDVRERAGADLARLCTPGWLARCELEIARLLARFELEPDVRDGLRMAVHLVRRFGTRSPIVEELAKLQVDECIDQRRRFADAMSARGLALPDVKMAWFDIVSWLEQVRPAILSFAEWFALRAVPDSMLETLWSSGIARSVCETCLDQLEDGTVDDASSWAGLAGVAMLGGMAPIGRFLAQETPLREATADEQVVYSAFQQGQRLEMRDGILHDIVRATEQRSDFAGAALIRETMRRVQNWKR
jgi:hypothetical protein